MFTSQPSLNLILIHTHVCNAGTMRCLSTRRHSLLGQRIISRCIILQTFCIVAQVRTDPHAAIAVLLSARRILILFVLCSARRYWCFGFEAKNQEVKHAAEASNYKKALKSATTTLSIQAARDLKKRKRGASGEAVTGLLLEE